MGLGCRIKSKIIWGIEDMVTAVLVQESASALNVGFDIVHSNALHMFPDLVRDLGGNPDDFMAAVGIDAEAIVKGGVEYQALVSLLALAAERLGVSDFGFQLAERQRGSKVIGPIGVVMRNSETLGQALGYCAKHIHAYSLATRVRFRPDRSRHILLVGLELLLDAAADSRQVVEHALLLAHHNIVDITGGGARARQVHLRHQPISPITTYRQYFGCEIEFDKERDGIVLSEDDLLCKVSGADEELFEMATSFIDHRFPPAVPPIHARVRALILQYLGSHDCRHERIANDMCMHPRTLQRRLRCEGVSFESIKDDVRREVALRYLCQSTAPLTLIAEKLGYAETSVLARSCVRWFEASPLQLRRQASKQAA